MNKQNKPQRTGYLRLFALICGLMLAVCNLTSAQALTANAGSNTSVCEGDSVQLGGNPAATGGTPPYMYSWQPANGLSSSNSSNPNASPVSTATYSLTVTDSTGTTSTGAITVTVHPKPIVVTGPDQTIQQGGNTTLQASGATNYFWYPTQGLVNQNTATPTAEPGSSTTYCVAGMNSRGCTNYDCTIIYVIPSDTIVQYNAFTPNGDGNNDFFYLGNIQKFSENKIEIYNRNGKLVYNASPYRNDWDGKIDGVELPCATYYYVLFPGNGKPKINGAVTLIR